MTAVRLLAGAASGSGDGGRDSLRGKRVTSSHDKSYTSDKLALGLRYHTLYTAFMVYMAT